MSYNDMQQFPGQQGAADGAASTGGAPPTQPQMGQPIESTAGQFAGGNMGVPTPTGGAPHGDGQKTTLWMGELEPWVDENFIRSLWYGMGEQVNVKMIRDKFTGSNAGYCFVDFSSPDAAAKALQLNGQQIPNSSRPFKLNWASGGGLADRSRDDRGPEYSIFVGDLGPEVNEYVLTSLFQNKYPSCKSAKIMTDPITNLSRGYGFVRFSDEAEQQRALTEMQGVYCGNRPMRISTATPKNKGGPGGQGGMGMHAQGPMGMYSMGAPPMGYYGSPQPMNQFTDPNNTTVFVGGLSGYVTEDELRSFFQGFGEITYVKIPPGKGCGFVQFVQRHAAEMAINQMQGYPIGNSRVRLSWGRSQNNSGPAGTPYRPAPPPPVYASMGMPPQHPYGPFAPMNSHYAHLSALNPAYQMFRQQPIPSASELATVQQQQHANAAAANANASMTLSPTGAATPAAPFASSIISDAPTGQSQANGQVNGTAPGVGVGLTGPPYGAVIPHLIQGPREVLPVREQNDLELGLKQARDDRLDAISKGREAVYGAK